MRGACLGIGQSKGIKEVSKVVGYFSYSHSGDVLCEGDACIIAGTEERMRLYIKRVSKKGERDTIKKTRFGEIMNGLRQGGAYAFDEESYSRFFDLAKINGMDFFPAKEEFLKNRPADGIQFVIIRPPSG
jgi:hypothetical protein